MKRILIVADDADVANEMGLRFSKGLDVHVIIGSSSFASGQEIAHTEGAISVQEFFELGEFERLKRMLPIHRPDMLIRSIDPLDADSYAVARACIEYGCDYIVLPAPSLLSRQALASDPGVELSYAVLANDPDHIGAL